MWLPRIKIKKSDTASGGTFLDENGNVYTGAFFETYAGEFFKGTKPSSNLQPLQPLDPFESQDPILDPTMFKTEFVKPSDKELTNGKFKRYFLQDTRSGNIVEIFKSKFDNLPNNLFSKKVAVDWILDGPKEDVYFNGIKQEGTGEINRKAILKAEETIKGLSDYVTDYTQFVKEQDKPLPDETAPASKAVFDIPSPS